MYKALLEKRRLLYIIFTVVNMNIYAQDINPANYEYSMSVTSILYVDGSVNATEGYSIEVYDGDELHGVANYDVMLDGYLSFLLVYSNSLSATYLVNIVNPEGNSLTVDTIDFVPNNIVGTVIDPIVYNLGANNLIIGCTSINYVEYNVDAQIHDQSFCLTEYVYGCTDSTYIEYNSYVNVDDGSCQTEIFYGCTDVNASNFEPNANTDNASCISWETAYNNLNLFAENLETEVVEQLDSIDALNSLLISLHSSLDSIASEVLNYESNIEELNVLQDSLVVVASNQLAIIDGLEVDLESAMANQEDGIGQSDVDSAYDQGVLDGDDGIYQSDVDQAYVEGVLSVIPEDGVHQSHVDEIQVQADSLMLAIHAQESIIELHELQIASHEFEIAEQLDSILVLTTLIVGFESLVLSQESQILVQLDSILLLNTSLVAYQASIDSLESEIISQEFVIEGLESDLVMAIANQEDGIGQSDVDSAYSQGVLDGDDGIYQSDVDQAYAEGVLSVIPEDGVNQSHVDQIQNQLDSLEVLIINQSDSIAIFEMELDSILLNQTSYIEADRYFSIPEGWSMFGYTCKDSIGVDIAFAEHITNIKLVKNELGQIWYPEWGYNGIGYLHYANGYQIKTHEIIEQFQFCPNIE